jgi:hypothetical protein
MLALTPSTVHLNATSAFLLSGNLTACGYTLHAVGQATPAQLNTLTQVIPALNDGVTEALPKSDSATKFDLNCTRLNWSNAQICAMAHDLPPATKKRRR